MSIGCGTGFRVEGMGQGPDLWGRDGRGEAVNMKLTLEKRAVEAKCGIDGCGTHLGEKGEGSEYMGMNWEW